LGKRLAKSTALGDSAELRINHALFKVDKDNSFSARPKAGMNG
jgi:hypothetical protein